MESQKNMAEKMSSDSRRTLSPAKSDVSSEKKNSSEERVSAFTLLESGPSKSAAAIAMGISAAPSSVSPGVGAGHFTLPFSPYSSLGRLHPFFPTPSHVPGIINSHRDGIGPLSSIPGATLWPDFSQLNFPGMSPFCKYIIYI